jgi:NhaP-type Na+/H+ or K+/H+ antiporter
LQLALFLNVVILSAMELLTATFALVGLVIVIAALLSGAIDKIRLPQVAVFILIGAALGPHGFDFLDVGLDSPLLQVVGILSLVLVLFTDAVSLSIREIRTHLRLAVMILGPGTLLIAFVYAMLGRLLLDLSWPVALLLGGALASTDPVMVRGLIRNPALPEPAKQGLRMESGLNDVVLLPIILICMAFLGEGPVTTSTLTELGIHLFLLGPGAGVVVAFLAIGLLEFLRRRFGIRRDYESLYSLGVALLAYAAAETVHGSGLLAAFAAGIVIALLDVELCDCFLEYGETTAEMALLFAFVLFGTSLIWEGLRVINLYTLLFAFAVILIRPVILFATLAGLKLDRQSKVLISWFGPRGLSTLLLMLIPIFAGTPGIAELFPVCCLVVLLSVLVHGGTQMFYGRRAKNASDAASDQSDVVVTVDQMLDLRKTNENVIVLDVRKAPDDQMARDSVRVSPDRAVQEVSNLQLPKDAWLIAFCA